MDQFEFNCNTILKHRLHGIGVNELMKNIECIVKKKLIFYKRATW